MRTAYWLIIVALAVLVTGTVATWRGARQAAASAAVVTREAILEAIARQENIDATDDEVASEIQRMAAAEPRQAARIRARYQTPERRRALRESLIEHKALDWVLQAADVQEEVASESPLVIPAGL